MADLFLHPVDYGRHDVVLPGHRNARVLYPTQDRRAIVEQSPIRPGTYPLVAFAHGHRHAGDGMCPPDLTRDYFAWELVLHTLAQHGFVVIIPDVHDAVSVADPTIAADVVREAVRWVRTRWAGRQVLWRSPALEYHPLMASRGSFDPTWPDLANPAETLTERLDALYAGVGPSAQYVDLGWPTPLGLAGHSWGGQAMFSLAARRELNVRAVASISGRFEDDATADAIYRSLLPSLMLVGSADQHSPIQTLLTFFNNGAPRHKHLAVIQDADHWSWFVDAPGWEAIYPCVPPDGAIPAQDAFAVAAGLLTGFMTKHLKNRWTVPGHLLKTSAFDIPNFEPLQVRWNDARSEPQVGATVFGDWTDPDPW